MVRLWTIHEKDCIEILYGNVRIVAAAPEDPPIPVDAIAVEEDTYLTLSTKPELTYPREDFNELIECMANDKPFECGSVLVRRGQPISLLAVIHDLYREPSSKKVWIENAVKNIFLQIDQLKINALGMPLIGTAYNSLDPSLALDIISNSLCEYLPQSLKRLWIMLPRDLSLDLSRHFHADT